MDIAPTRWVSNLARKLDSNCTDIRIIGYDWKRRLYGASRI